MANKIHYLKATMGGAHRHVHTTIALCERKHNVLVSESPFTLDESKVTCKRCLDHLHTRKVRADRRRIAPTLVLKGQKKYRLEEVEDQRSANAVAWKVMTTHCEDIELGIVVQSDWNNRFMFIANGFHWSNHLRLNTAIVEGIRAMLEGKTINRSL